MKLCFLIALVIYTANCSHSPDLVNSRLIEIADVADKTNDLSLGSLRIKQAQDYVNNSFDQLNQIKTKKWMQDRIYFDSLRRINFYLNDPRLNVILEKFYWKLQEKGFAKEEDAKDLYDYFLVNRQTDEAMAFYKKLPDFLTENYNPILKISKPQQQITGPSLLHLNGKNTAEQKPFPASTFTGVVIVASPNCSFSKNALSDLYKNQKKDPNI